MPGNIGLCVGWVNAHGAADEDGLQCSVADFSRHSAGRNTEGSGKLGDCKQGRHGYVMHLFWCRLRVMRHHRQAQQFVPKFQRRGVRLSLAEGRLVRCLPALVVKTNLVRPGWPVPSQFKRRVRAVVVKPSRFVRPVPVGALPNLAHPTAIDGSLPANPSRLRQSVRCPCLRFRRVFEHPAKAPHAIQRRSKTAAVIARLVVLAAPAGIVHVRHRAPQLAGRVRNNRQRPGVASGVPLLRPSINARQVCIAPARLHKQGSQAHNIAVKRTCRLRRFAPSRHSAYLQR